MNIEMAGSEIVEKIRVKDIHNALPLGVIIIRESAEYSELIDFNEYACSLFDSTREQMYHLFSGEHSLFHEDIYKKSIKWLIENGNKSSTDFICPCEDTNHKKMLLRILCTYCQVCGTSIIYAAVIDTTEEVAIRRAEQFEMEKHRLYYETSDVNIFEFNIAENTLRVWRYEHGIEVKRFVIKDFKERIARSGTVYSDDRQKCQDFFALSDLDKKFGVFEIRMQLHERGYRWYRIYFKLVYDENEQAKLIFGRAEDIQKSKDDEDALAAKSRIEALYRHSISEHAIFSIEIDLTIGKRIVTDFDITPNWFPENLLYDTGVIIRNQIIHPEDRENLDEMVKQFDEGYTLHDSPVATHCECRLRHFFSDKQDYHWCRIYAIIAKNEANDHRQLFLSAVDIDRDKKMDYERWSIASTDPSTGLLTRQAFEKRISVWAAKNRHERNPQHVPVLAAAVIAVDDMNQVEIAREDSAEATSVTATAQSIKAFVRPDEICCRDGASEFAIVIHDATGEDAIVVERLRMLYLALVSKLASEEKVVISIGYIILNPNVDFKVQVLKRARYAMNLARMQEGNRFVQFSEEIKPEKRKKIETTDQSVEENESEIQGSVIGGKQIFIRTCGVFDVFVDGKAILFSHAKSKELLAVLVDRRGGYVTAKEAIGKLWEDDIPFNTKMNRYRKASMFLRETLAEHGVEQIVEVFKKKRRINTNTFECDYIQYTSNDWIASQFIPASYLSEYSWAESSIAFLEALRRQRHLQFRSK